MGAVSSETGFQPHTLLGPAAGVWPVHLWVASLLSMDSMILVMILMMTPCLGGGPGVLGAAGRPVEVGFKTALLRSEAPSEFHP